jgi:hypothetical protein
MVGLKSKKLHGFPTKMLISEKIGIFGGSLTRVGYLYA